MSASTFTSLPAELRAEIMRHYIQDNKCTASAQSLLFSSRWVDPNKAKPRERDARRIKEMATRGVTKKLPSLLLVNKQISKEFQAVLQEIRQYWIDLDLNTMASLRTGELPAPLDTIPDNIRYLWLRLDMRRRSLLYPDTARSGADPWSRPQLNLHVKPIVNFVKKFSNIRKLGISFVESFPGWIPEPTKLHEMLGHELVALDMPKLRHMQMHGGHSFAWCPRHKRLESYEDIWEERRALSRQMK